jgi:hypothetical protein
MQHEWVFEVLKDLKLYAARNSLPALAARVEEALAVAEVEITGAAEKGIAALAASLHGNERSQ